MSTSLRCIVNTASRSLTKKFCYRFHTMHLNLVSLGCIMQMEVSRRWKVETATLIDFFAFLVVSHIFKVMKVFKQSDLYHPGRRLKYLFSSVYNLCILRKTTTSFTSFFIHGCRMSNLWWNNSFFSISPLTMHPNSVLKFRIPNVYQIHKVISDYSYNLYNYYTDCMVGFIHLENPSVCIRGGTV